MVRQKKKLMMSSSSWGLFVERRSIVASCNGSIYSGEKRGSAHLAILPLTKREVKVNGDDDRARRNRFVFFFSSSFLLFSWGGGGGLFRPIACFLLSDRVCPSYLRRQWKPYSTPIFVQLSPYTQPAASHNKLFILFDCGTSCLRIDDHGTFLYDRLETKQELSERLDILPRNVHFSFGSADADHNSLPLICWSSLR